MRQSTRDLIDKSLTIAQRLEPVFVFTLPKTETEDELLWGVSGNCIRMMMDATAFYGKSDLALRTQEELIERAQELRDDLIGIDRDSALYSVLDARLTVLVSVMMSDYAAMFASCFGDAKEESLLGAFSNWPVDKVKETCGSLDSGEGPYVMGALCAEMWNDLLVAVAAAAERGSIPRTAVAAIGEWLWCMGRADYSCMLLDNILEGGDTITVAPLHPVAGRLHDVLLWLGSCPTSLKRQAAQ